MQSFYMLFVVMVTQLTMAKLAEPTNYKFLSVKRMISTICKLYIIFVSGGKSMQV